MALFYAAIMVLVILGFVSFAVDYGRVQTAKMELRNAVDAAARYAVTGVHNSTALTKAQQAAAQNTVDGTALVLQNADVEVITWDHATRSYTVGGTAPNAVRVSGARTASRGNAIPLPFARAIGITTCDIHSSSIAVMDPQLNIVGLDSVGVYGANSRIERLSTETGSMVAASNGTWTTNSANLIVSNVLYRGSTPSASIVGTVTPMYYNLAYAAPTVPAGAQYVGAVNWLNSQPIPAGNYHVTSMSLNSNTFTLTGDVNIYCTGSVSITGTAFFDTNNGQHKLRIYLTNASSMTYSSSATTYLGFYGPTSTFTVGGGAVHGSVVARTITVNNNSKLRYTELLPINVRPTSGGTSAISAISSVR